MKHQVLFYSKDKSKNKISVICCNLCLVLSGLTCLLCSSVSVLGTGDSVYSTTADSGNYSAGSRQYGGQNCRRKATCTQT